MSDRSAVLFANEQFYVAFASCDLAGMQRIWASNVDVSCIHPGRGPILGREEVLESWQSIFSNPDSPEIQCRDPKVNLHTNIAVISCLEQIDNQLLCATNVFVCDTNLWNIVHHQSGTVSLDYWQTRDQLDKTIN